MEQNATLGDGTEFIEEPGCPPWTSSGRRCRAPRANTVMYDDGDDLDDPVLIRLPK